MVTNGKEPLSWTDVQSRGPVTLSGRRDSNPRPLDPQRWNGSTSECQLVSACALSYR
jgi:hypothetical protein